MYKKRQLSKVHLTTLASLKDVKCFNQCFDCLLSSAEQFLFVPSDDGLLPPEMCAEWERMRDTEYWKRLHKCTKSRKKDKVSSIIKTYRLKNWLFVLQEGIYRQRGLITAASAETISRLGLIRETVAADNWSCNRYVNTRCVLVMSLDAYKLITEDISINNKINYSLSSRRPPLLMAVFFLDM